MKKIFIFAFITSLAFCAVAKPKEPFKATIQETFKSDKYNRQLGYQLTNSGERITFVFYPDAYGIKKPKRVFVEGSFNGWKKKDVNWELEQTKASLWTIEADTADVKIPGNSGFPEFKFYVIADVEYIETVCGKELTRYRQEIFEPKAISRIPGFQMSTNNLILTPDDNPLEIVANEKLTQKERKLKEFDLENPEDIAKLSNVRLVPGTTKLYRGYHPYKLSRGNMDTEQKRLFFVNKALKDNGVKSIITLSGDEQVDPAKEQISVYVGDIRRAGNQFFVDTKYNTVYYNSTSSEFCQMIADILRFINTHEGPYYVHCRLGTDRTGVVSAVLAALCGATWQEIASDYQKTNLMGIKEFRDSRLLAYSFEQMLGKNPAQSENLKQDLTNYFTERGFLRPADIAELNEALK